MIKKTVQQVLLVFSDKEKQVHIQEIFPVEQFHVILSNSGENAINLVKKMTPELIVMDVTLEEMDGIETCQIIRKQLHVTEPVIVFLTDIHEDYTQIAAYEAGADDFLSFSIRPRLFLSKVNTLLQRKNLCCPSDKQIINVPLVIDRNRFAINYLEKYIILTKKEFLLLEVLAKGEGKVISRDQLMKLVWSDDTNIGDRTIDVHIRKIREKTSIDLIRTITGIGYQLNVEVILL